jgi:hypothetical protein
VTMHRIGCASLERRAACTCGAEAAGVPWGWLVGAVLLVVVLLALVAF